MQLGPKNSSFVQAYSYKPVIYFLVAAVYHLRARSLKATWLFIHAGAILSINQYDLSTEAAKMNKEKWDESKEAGRNYQTALSMIDVSLWGYLSKLFKEKF